MNRRSIISRHIVLTTHPGVVAAVCGIILMEDEIISDVVILDNSFQVSQILAFYSEWNPEDLSDYYISPGLIDLNSRVEWDSFTEFSKAAISGGVTFALSEQSYYGNNAPTGDLYCDIGRTATIQLPTTTDFESLQEQGFFAVKAYLFPPHNGIKPMANRVAEIIDGMQGKEMLLIIDPTIPDERMLHSVSPFRLRELEDRLKNEIKVDYCFGAAFPDDVENPDDMDIDVPTNDGDLHLNIKVKDDYGNAFKEGEEEEEEEEEEMEKSDLVTSLPKVNPLSPCGSRLKRRIQSLPTQSTIPSDNASPSVLSSLKDPLDEDLIFRAQIQSLKGKPKPKVNHFFDDLDRKIQNTNMLIQAISVAEYDTYKTSGVTQFSSPRVGSSPFSTSLSNSSDSCASLSPPSSIFQRRGSISCNLTLSIKPSTSTTPESSACHIASYSHTWELAGIDRILEYPGDLRLHISNISAASSFNKLRKLKSLHPRLTWEVPASHLVFSTSSIDDKDTRFKNSPPFRSQTNTDLLWELLKCRGIDTISSNHVCIHPDFKRKDGNFQRAVNGMPLVGYSLAAVWSKIYNGLGRNYEKEMMIVHMARWLSTSPAEILGVGEYRGSIDKGKFADLIVWRPQEKFVVTEGALPFQGLSPFIGKELYGKIYRVVIRGATAFNQGMFEPVGRVILKQHS